MKKNFFTGRGVETVCRVLVLFVLMLNLAGCAMDTATIAESRTQFEIHRGTNVSHWLSQNTARGEERRNFITERDIQNIATLGFDHVRIPVDEIHFWKEDGSKDEEAFALLHDAINWCQKNNLKVIIDLHVLRSHHFNREPKTLWNDPEEQEIFFNLWRDLSEEYGHYPVTEVAYELLNEPVAPDPLEWNVLIKKTLDVIRENEPNRVVIVGSNGRQSTYWFNHLQVPADDKNIILSFHYYSPLLLTHYKAAWIPIGDYTGPVNYPGQTVKSDVLAGLPQEMAQRLIAFGADKVSNASTIEADFKGPISVANRYGLKLYCGEFGALVTAPKEDRLRWYRDIRKVLEKNNIAWANWDYKSTGFGFTNGNGENHDREIIKILTGR